MKIFRMNGKIYPKVFGLFLLSLWEDFFVWKKGMEVNLFMKYIRGIYSVQLIKLTGVSSLLADCAEDH